MTTDATRRRVPRPGAVPLVLVAVIACWGDTANYGPPHDDVAMAAIASEWTAHDPYAFPYALDLSCLDQGAPCRISGTITEDGRLAASVRTGSPEGPPSRHSLTRVGAAACP